MAKKTTQRPVAPPRTRPSTPSPKNVPIRRNTPSPGTVSGRPPKKS